MLQIQCCKSHGGKDRLFRAMWEHVEDSYSDRVREFLHIVQRGGYIFLTNIKLLKCVTKTNKQKNFPGKSFVGMHKDLDERVCACHCVGVTPGSV